MPNPLVSVIVPTKNSSKFLEACLRSVKEQSYKRIELIVVDNSSTDDTQAIARRITDKVFTKGPERSAQRNFGAAQAAGEYVVFIDSDMVLSKGVIGSCVQAMASHPNAAGVIIPEESFGVGFWAQCKKLERSFYVGVDAIEAARFFGKAAFEKAGGYNEALISGEDWDLSDRIEALGNIVRIGDFIYHNEGRISLGKTLRKKHYYARQARAYLSHSKGVTGSRKRTGGILSRYALFFSQPGKLLKNPVRGCGMLFMKTCEFIFGGVALIKPKI
jgi:glycosyltransferase involved in cell wall biosynthesis